MKKLLHIFLSILILNYPLSISFAATGCSYPTSLDTFLDKSTGDFLTVSDVNVRSCAIEKLESGPLRPNDGSAGAPAYSFLNDSDTGIFRPAPNAIGFSLAGSEVLRLDSTGLRPVGAGSIAATGGFGSIGQTSKNNAGTPNTQFDLDADVVILRDTTNGTVVRYNPGAALTNDVTITGPAANGRDQAGAFSASSWIHFYWIWNGTTLATVSSATAPPTGPTLPSGYTHWGYAAAVRFNGSSQLIKTRILGHWAYYEAEVNALSGGTATSETSVSLTAIIPPNAAEVAARFSITTASISSPGTDSLGIRVVSGTTYSFPAVTVGNSTIDNIGVASQIFPNNGQAVLYFINRGSSGGTVAGAINVVGYSLPNGGA